MSRTISAKPLFSVTLLALSPLLLAQTPPATNPPAPKYDDHQNMMDQLGLKKLRPGANANDPANAVEATANPYKDSLPDLLTFNDGSKVSSPDQWPKRRAEIEELFAREVYGRIPPNVPAVTWQVTNTTTGTTAGIPTITKTLVGHVDNSAFPALSVNIQASFTVPANASAPVPIMIEFGGGGGFGGGFGARGRGPRGTGVPPVGGWGGSPRAAAPASAPTLTRVPTSGPAAPANPNPPWTQQALAHGWGYGNINPASIQPDNNQLLTGIIGLTNKGQPRTPDQWGALRAWQWGTSRLIDYFEQNPDSHVDPKKVGIEGLSRYGKAALVTEAFDTRIAVGLVGSSGEGGAKLHRHIFGEAVENLAGGEYYWMAGNFMKYGAADPPKTVADLPVDSHELIALCAPRPCFISYGSTTGGDPNWVDAHGSFEAAILASPAYELLGAKGLPTSSDYLTTPMPPINTLLGAQLAWRQHPGGHDVTPNWPAFFTWIAAYIH